MYKINEIELEKANQIFYLSKYIPIAFRFILENAKEHKDFSIEGNYKNFSKSTDMKITTFCMSVKRLAVFNIVKLEPKGKGHGKYVKITVVNPDRFYIKTNKTKKK